MSNADDPQARWQGHDFAKLTAFATQNLAKWNLPHGARVRLLNISENATFLVEAEAGFRAVLRIHRKHYHSRLAITCELAWMQALRSDGILPTTSCIPGRDQNNVQEAILEPDAEPFYLVLFNFVAGREPEEGDDLTEPFVTLGEIAAKLHLHTRHWQKPQPFERLRWDIDDLLGANARWGDWRNGPGVNVETRRRLEPVEETLRRRLTRFGRGDDRFGLIHADMRLANLLINETDIVLIDFDDCGFGWYLYDFAAAVSFMEDDPRLPQLKAAWLKGYRGIRPLSESDAQELDSFVMLRRFALLGWIGTHAAVDIARQLAPHYAANTVKLGCDYLAD